MQRIDFISNLSRMTELVCAGSLSAAGLKASTTPPNPLARLLPGDGMMGGATQLQTAGDASIVAGQGQVL